MGILIASMLADSRCGDDQTPCFDRFFPYDAHSAAQKERTKTDQNRIFPSKDECFQTREKALESQDSKAFLGCGDRI